MLKINADKNLSLFRSCHVKKIDWPTQHPHVTMQTFLSSVKLDDEGPYYQILHIFHYIYGVSHGKQQKCVLILSRNQSVVKIRRKLGPSL